MLIFVTDPGLSVQEKFSEYHRLGINVGCGFLHIGGLGKNVVFESLKEFPCKGSEGRELDRCIGYEIYTYSQEELNWI